MGHTLQNVTADSVCHHTFCYLRVSGPPPVERCYDTMLFCVIWREDAELCGCTVEESLSTAWLGTTLPINRLCQLSIRVMGKSSAALRVQFDRIHTTPLHLLELRTGPDCGGPKWWGEIVQLEKDKPERREGRTDQTDPGRDFILQVFCLDCISDLLAQILMGVL